MAKDRRELQIDSGALRSERPSYSRHMRESLMEIAMSDSNPPSAGRFVLTGRLDPPTLRTLMVRAGGSVFWAYLSPWWGWKSIYANSEEAIPAPTWWWLDDDLAAELAVEPGPEISFIPPTTRKGQLLLCFDIGLQSGRKV
jgi:hypothetical protein